MVAKYNHDAWGNCTISGETTDYLNPESPNGLNLYCYCNNDPVNYADPSGHMPNWVKWLIGGIMFAGAVALTILTGGALTPLFVGMGVSIISGGLIGGVISAHNGDSFWSGFKSGAADGAMWVGISALGGAVLRTIKLFKNGVVIGESMDRVRWAAKELRSVTYAGKPGYSFIKAIKGEAYASSKLLAHNQAWLNRMMKWGVKVIDISDDVVRVGASSPYYAMETAMANSYWNLLPAYLI